MLVLIRLINELFKVRIRLTGGVVDGIDGGCKGGSNVGDVGRPRGDVAVDGLGNGLDENAQGRVELGDVAQDLGLQFRNSGVQVIDGSGGLKLTRGRVSALPGDVLLEGVFPVFLKS